jgi:glycosyltransferase involved in cell wall biosynthesis
MGYQATIVIPVLNQLDAWLERSVRSALAQTVECEVLVVTSPDTKAPNRNTLSRLRSQSPTLKVIQQQKAGFAVGLNVGIRSASALRVGFLLSDDWLEPTAVEKAMQRLADIVSPGQTTYAADGKTHMDWASKILTVDEYSRLPSLERKADYLGHFFLFQNRALFEVGGLDESLGDSPGVDDFDLIWTLLEHDASVEIVEESLYNYRDHDGERLTTRRPDEMTATMNRILDKHKVTGSEREQILARHARWFGKPMYALFRGMCPRRGWLHRQLHP